MNAIIELSALTPTLRLLDHSPAYSNGIDVMKEISVDARGNRVYISISEFGKREKTTSIQMTRDQWNQLKAFIVEHGGLL